MNWNDLFIYKSGHIYRIDGSKVETTHSMGYSQVTIKGELHLVHRIVWEMHNGPIPKGFIIDHDDRNKFNNNISNLRLVSYEQNQKNRSKSKNNTSGVTGVVWDKARCKWAAQIQVKGKNKTLGRFLDMTDAITARKTAEMLYGFHPNHGT